MDALERRTTVLRERLGVLERRLEAVERRLVEMHDGTAMNSQGDVAEAGIRPSGGERHRVGLLEMAQIRAALARIARGTYGTCCCCGRAIADVRLDEAPETPLCQTCTT